MLAIVRPTLFLWPSLPSNNACVDRVASPKTDSLLTPPEKSTAKGRKTMVKLPWELFTPFSDFLRTIPNAQNTNREDDEEEDEDEMQAHQESMQRLRVSSSLPL